MPALLKSHIVPRQLLIKPRSLHFGHIHMITSVSGLMNPTISSWHGLRFGRLRHFTLYSGGYSGSGNVAMNTIAVKYSAMAFACAGSEIIFPSSSRKWLKSVIHVSAISKSLQPDSDIRAASFVRRLFDFRFLTTIAGAFG